jgi:biotin carboxylase
LLVLGAGPAQLGVLEAARRRDLVVVAADRDPAAPGLPLADRRAIVSIEDEPAVERLARAEQVDGIVAPGSDHAVALAARVASRLALPHPLTPEAALVASSRRRQRERLAETGVPQPRSVLCRTYEEVAAAAEELGYPCVVEAPDALGERGVVLVPDRDTLARAAAEAVAESRDSYCLVEELVGERLVAVTGFLLAGTLVPLLVTDREQAPPPAFGVPLLHLWPAGLTDDERTEVLRLVDRAAAALGLRDGPLTAQVLVKPDGPLLAKLSARTDGGHGGDLCRAALGVDLDDAAVSAALGGAPDEEQLRPTASAGGACVRFLVAPPGELRASTGVEAACEVAGVRLVRLYRQPGHRFRELRRASDRAGAIVATGADLAGARRAAETAAGRIELVTQPFEAAA